MVTNRQMEWRTRARVIIYCQTPQTQYFSNARLVAKGRRQRLSLGTRTNTYTTTRRLHPQPNILEVIIDGRGLADNVAGGVLFGGKVLLDFVGPFDAVTG